MKLGLLSAVSAANSAPSAATAGVPLRRRAVGLLSADDGFPFDVDEASLYLWNASGTGALSLAYARLWVYIDGFWQPLGTGTAADKGKLNRHDDGTGTISYEIESHVNDKLRHIERVRGFMEAERIYLELGAFTGTMTVSARLRAIVKSGNH